MRSRAMSWYDPQPAARARPVVRRHMIFWNWVRRFSAAVTWQVKAQTLDFLADNPLYTQRFY